MLVSLVYFSTLGQVMKEAGSRSHLQEAAYRIFSHIHLWNARVHRAHATTSPTSITFGLFM